MLSSTYLVERTAAGSRRSIAAATGFGPSARTGAFSAHRDWVINPSAMGVKVTPRHDLTPAPRPEEAVP
jgi:hypothetical protein